MSTVKCTATNLITGQLMADSIPLEIESCTMNLNGGGTLTGQLQLQQPYVLNAPYLSALQAGLAVLWVLQDGQPVWVGGVWDQPDMSRQNGGPLSIQASTMDALWGKRIISDTLEYPAVDLYTVFLDLLSYGMTKRSRYISTAAGVPDQRPAGMLAWMASNGKVADLVLPAGQAAGVPWTASYMWSDRTAVSDAWSDMVSSGNFEYAFVPGVQGPGQYCINVQLGYEQLGRPLGQSGYSVNFGQGGNCLDYGYQVTYSQGANALWATAPANGALEQWGNVYPAGWDLTALRAGYPVMESTVSWEGSTVTQQSQIDAFADGELEILTQGMTTPVLTIGGGGFPDIPDLQLGDSFWFTATSPLHPPVTSGGQVLPGLQQQLRLTGWTWTPPGPNQGESLQLSTTAVAGT